MAIEWIVVRDRNAGKPIGAIGFIGDEIALVTAFYDDKDWDHSGTVELSEKVFSIFSLRGKALTEVACRAYEDPDIAMRDPSLGEWRANLLTKFANGMIIEGIYKTYMAYSIGQAAGVIAVQVAPNAIASYVLKKGMEKAVEASFKELTAIR